MFITERKLRKVIRQLISESKKFKPDDMAFTYNNVDVDILDSGDVFMYGDINIFNDKVKNLFEKLDIDNIISLIKKYREDDSLDDRKKRIRMLSVYKPVKAAFLDEDFLKMLNDIRLCKFVKNDKKDWIFYDMSLRGLLQGESSIDQYAYVVEMEKDGEEGEPGFRGFGLFKRQIKPENFQLIDKDLIRLANKIGTLKLIFKDKKMMNGFRSRDEMKNILFRHDLIKKFVKNQYEFDSDSQIFK